MPTIRPEIKGPKPLKPSEPATDPQRWSKCPLKIPDFFTLPVDLTAHVFDFGADGWQLK
jgi:hypothetical protein